MTCMRLQYGKRRSGVAKPPGIDKTNRRRYFAGEWISPSIGACDIEMCNDISKVWPYTCPPEEERLGRHPPIIFNLEPLSPLSTIAPGRPYRFCAAYQPSNRLSCLDCQSRTSWTDSMTRLGKRKMPVAQLVPTHSDSARPSQSTPVAIICGAPANAHASSGELRFNSIHLPWRLEICLNVE